MTFSASISADDLLAIPKDEPERLFTGAVSMKDEFRQLAKLWHPDQNRTDPRAPLVFSHLTLLHEAAEEKLRRGIWAPPGQLLVTDVDGKYWRLNYYKRRAFELGDLYYGRKALGFLLGPGQADRVRAAAAAIRGNSFSNDAMRAEMEKYLPSAPTVVAVNDGRTLVVMPKTPDVYLLDDVRKALGGTIDPKHVAWILSSLFNIACYLEYVGTVHNAFLSDAIFVSPEHHSALLLGGWWYAAKSGAPITHLPTAVYRLAPSTVLRGKRADHQVDRISIRAIGRELLGDATGMSLKGRVPDPMLTFLRSPPLDSAVKDYGAWRVALESSFGPRRFVELVLPESAIKAT